MKTEDTPLHGSYFDLAAAKHPDLQVEKDGESRREKRAEPPPEKRRKRFGKLPALLGGALVGVVWLAIVLKPEAGSPPATEESSASVPAAPVAAPPATPEPTAEASTTTEPATEPEPVEPRVAEAASPEPAAAEPAAAAAAPPKVAAKPADAEVDAVPPPTPAKAADDAVAAKPVPPPVEPVTPPPAATKPAATKPAAPEPAATKPAATKPAATKPAAPEPAATFVAARKISATAPVYPEAARQAGEEGTVVVEAQVDATGAVTGTRVVRGRSPELDAAAEAALGKWRFEPALRDGVAVASSVRVGIRFDLEETAAAAPATPLEVGGDVAPPRRLETPLPAYPNAAWAAGATGDVLVRAVIDENGKVTDVEVLRGQPYGMTEAAVEAIRRWTFVPATLHGRPVAVYHNLSVSFEG